MGQVVQAPQPTQFDQFSDKRGIELLPGSIRVKLRSSPPTTITAVPANVNFINVPLYGEQVLIFSAISGLTEDTKTNQYYYMTAIGVHGQVNNNIMPFIQDVRVNTKNYMSTGISSTTRNKVPEQLSFEISDIIPIQPYQGDNIIQDRFGSALRFSSTHKNLTAYSQKPFWQGSVVGDPFVALSCGINSTRKPGYFSIENPDKDSSFIYLSSTQKINNLKLSQKKIGSQTKPLSSYTAPQVIISSDRLIFNAREDELVLVSKKDIKLSTPNWSIDVDNLVTQLEALVTAITKMTHTTGAGPSGPPINITDFTKILSEIKRMKQ